MDAIVPQRLYLNYRIKMQELSTAKKVQVRM